MLDPAECVLNKGYPFGTLKEGQWRPITERPDGSFKPSKSFFRRAEDLDRSSRNANDNREQWTVIR